MSDTDVPRRLIYVTGMAGAGMSTLLKTLEDLGYEAVDNLRTSMIPALVTQSAADAQGVARPVAIGIDSRNVEFNAAELLFQIRQMRGQKHLAVSLVFLDCSDDVLLRRFSETRRRHPLALDRPVVDGIQVERGLMQPLREQADLALDTSLLSLHELRRLAVGHFRFGQQNGLNVFVTSFAFRHGVPREADMVFDVRFLANPHWDAALRPLTGRDAAVGSAIAKDSDFAPFMAGLVNLLTPLLPRYTQEGKSYLTIAIGCTGGRHRSVYVAEQLTNALAAQGYIVGVSHRDCERETR